MSEEGVTLRELFEAQIRALDIRLDQMDHARELRHIENTELLRRIDSRLTRLERAMWTVAGAVGVTFAVYGLLPGHLLPFFMR